MSYPAMDIDGMDLFTMPFRSTQASMAVPVSRSQPMAPRTAPPVQQPKAQKPVEQNHDIPEKPALGRTRDAEYVQEQKPLVKAPEPEKKQPSKEKPSTPQKELVMDMSDHAIPAGKPLDASEDAKRKAHEEAEAKRKAEWEVRQREKREKEEAALQKLQSMSDADAVAASTECVRVAIERITRRNMKECVAGHIQELCQKDPVFARCVMHPKKSLIN